MCSLDIQLILRVIILAIMLGIRLVTMSAIRLVTMLATRLGTMLANTPEATSTTLLEGSTISSLPTLLPNTSTLATLVLDSRLQTPLTEQIRYVTQTGPNLTKGGFQKEKRYFLGI